MKVIDTYYLSSDLDLNAYAKHPEVMLCYRTYDEKYTQYDVYLDGSLVAKLKEFLENYKQAFGYPPDHGALNLFTLIGHYGTSIQFFTEEYWESPEEDEEEFYACQFILRTLGPNGEPQKLVLSPFTAKDAETLLLSLKCL